MAGHDNKIESYLKEFPEPSDKSRLFKRNLILLSIIVLATKWTPIIKLDKLQPFGAPIKEEYIFPVLYILVFYFFINWVFNILRDWEIHLDHTFSNIACAKNSISLLFFGKPNQQKEDRANEQRHYPTIAGTPITLHGKKILHRCKRKDENGNIVFCNCDTIEADFFDTATQSCNALVKDKTKKTTEVRPDVLFPNGRPHNGPSSSVETFSPRKYSILRLTFIQFFTMEIIIPMSLTLGVFFTMFFK